MIELLAVLASIILVIYKDHYSGKKEVSIRDKFSGMSPSEVADALARAAARAKSRMHKPKDPGNP